MRSTRLPARPPRLRGPPRRRWFDPDVYARLRERNVALVAAHRKGLDLPLDVRHRRLHLPALPLRRARPARQLLGDRARRVGRRGRDSRRASSTSSRTSTTTGRRSRRATRVALSSDRAATLSGTVDRVAVEPRARSRARRRRRSRATDLTVRRLAARRAVTRLRAAARRGALDRRRPSEVGARQVGQRASAGVAGRDGPPTLAPSAGRSATGVGARRGTGRRWRRHGERTRPRSSRVAEAA